MKALPCMSDYDPINLYTVSDEINEIEMIIKYYEAA
jgi:hypothetical protein